MKVAITGGTGFVGRHLAQALSSAGHETVIISRGRDRRDPSVMSLPHSTYKAIGTENKEALIEAFRGCDVVAHCAGINRETGNQTYERVHVEGTRNVVEAAMKAGVSKFILIGFLRARPNCGSKYHESKFSAEEIVRGSALDYVIFKPGVIYGRGDHMLDHLTHALCTVPVFGLVGFEDHPMRPLAIEDLVSVMVAAMTDARLSRKTFAVTGPEELTLETIVRRVGKVIGKQPLFIHLPLFAHYCLAYALEKVMKIALVSVAQVRILSESLVEPLPAAEALPPDLMPRLPFSEAQIKKGIPEIVPFSLADCNVTSVKGRDK